MERDKNTKIINMKENIAVVEFKSISRGIVVTDEMLKTADINIVISGSLCPGKYLAVLEGEISALNSTLKVAERIGGRHLFSSFLISGISTKVLEAIKGKSSKKTFDAIGIVESLQMADLINSSDIAVDSADIDFVEYRLARGCGVNSFYIINGQLSAVNEAAKNAVNFLGQNGSLIAYKVIPGPDREVWKWIKTSLCHC